MQSVALCTALALGFQAPGAFVSRRTTAIVASEEPPTKDATEIFTLQDREDGWDDVRGSIKDAIKDREKPIALVREKYVEPAKRWSKAFAEVTAETLDEVGITSGSVVPTNLPNLKAPALPTLSAPALDKKSITKSAIGSLAGVLDAAGDARQAKKQSAKPVKKTKQPVGLVATANSASFFGLWGLGVGGTLVYLFTSEYFS